MITSVLGILSLAVLVLSSRHRIALPWAVLLCMTWLGGFADYWLFPLVNGTALFLGVALMIWQQMKAESYGGMVTAIFPIMIAFDVGYRLGAAHGGLLLGMTYYYSLIGLFLIQLGLVGHEAVKCWISGVFPTKDECRDRSDLLRVFGGMQWRIVK